MPNLVAHAGKRAGRVTSVGTAAIDRFLLPVSYQDYPDALLPAALRDANSLGLPRTVNDVGRESERRRSRLREPVGHPAGCAG
ncbi:hypothetical protein E1202_08400 [Saccharopolyspora karakumensis]|uniref:Uncharacterized protein n=1 Tax=Saccharopolyspora karakumensis TaxID=2530386 RepID=A0A4R5BY45_9PSEU|nr:hypothetical protein [Saccharopolyspora karakumensis]TDD90633.1 hypothetical protein E1202_08400 [Saccharopolyspora karakumensis]